jgi:hypothetical protein
MKVALKVHNTEKLFSIEHAERLLRMPNNGGWELPKDSPFEFKNNGLRKKSSKRNTQKSEKQTSDSKSDKASESDKVSYGNETE